MATSEPQNYGNHVRWVPAYHFLIGPILLLNLGWSLYQLVVASSMAAVVAFLLAIALLSMFLHLRFFPLAAQDRLIRLEERMRLEQRHRIEDLTLDQLIALRFASDAEVGGLAMAVLDEGQSDREAIKKRVTDWRSDHQRV